MSDSLKHFKRNPSSNLKLDILENQEPMTSKILDPRKMQKNPGNISMTRNNKSFASNASEKKFSSTQILNTLGSALAYFDTKKELKTIAQEKVETDEENSKNEDIDNQSINFEEYYQLKVEVENYKRELKELNDKLNKLTNTSRIASNSSAFMKTTLEDVLSLKQGYENEIQSLKCSLKSKEVQYKKYAYLYSKEKEEKEIIKQTFKRILEQIIAAGKRENIERFISPNLLSTFQLNQVPSLNHFQTYSNIYASNTNIQSFNDLIPFDNNAKMDEYSVSYINKLQNLVVQKDLIIKTLKSEINNGKLLSKLENAELTTYANMTAAKKVISDPAKLSLYKSIGSNDHPSTSNSKRSAKNTNLINTKQKRLYQVGKSNKLTKKLY